MTATGIVVGTDGHPAGREAVRWAAREAHRRGVPLRIMLAYDWHWQGSRFGGVDELRVQADNEAAAVVADAATEATAVAPGVVVRGETALGEPAPALLRAAKRATLLVVGSRGHGGFASLLLGSVSQRVATHSPCAVAVVRGRPDATEGPIVVGVDGSPAAQEALGLAFQMAAERKTSVIAIRAYTPPTPPWGANVPPLVYDPQELDAAEHAALDGSLSGWREKFPQVRVEALIARGSAARVLVGVSHTAQLVVVGSRGHGTIAGTLLGSVGLQLLHHADCPVLIARTPVHA